MRAADLGSCVNVTTQWAWWQTTRTARQGLALGCLFAAIGAGQLILGASPSGLGWNLVLGVIWLAVAAVQLGSAAALWRHERSAATRTNPEKLENPQNIEEPR
jgi:heme A synthase